MNFQFIHGASHHHEEGGVRSMRKDTDANILKGKPVFFGPEGHGAY